MYIGMEQRTKNVSLNLTLALSVATLKLKGRNKTLHYTTTTLQHDAGKSKPCICTNIHASACLFATLFGNGNS